MHAWRERNDRRTLVVERCCSRWGTCARKEGERERERKGANQTYGCASTSWLSCLAPSSSTCVENLTCFVRRSRAYVHHLAIDPTGNAASNGGSCSRHQREPGRKQPAPLPCGDIRPKRHAVRWRAVQARAFSARGLPNGRPKSPVLDQDLPPEY